MSRKEIHVPTEFCRNAGTVEDLRDEEVSINSALWLIDHMCGHLGLADLAGLDVLDFGCGVRFAQAIVNRDLPVGRYVGVDVYREMLDFLRANITDPRIELVHLDAHNALYNPTGQPFDAVAASLEIRGSFDVTCMFSVVTHLAPDDYASVLRLLRRFVAPQGRLFFTLFIAERTEGGHGLMDKFDAALSTSTDRELQAAIAERLEAGIPAEPPPFQDLDPGNPLMYAVYSRQHALELIEGTGWEVVSVSDPGPHLQHHIVCTPR